MACFVVPAVEAVVVSAVDKCTRKKEAPKDVSENAVAEISTVVPFRQKIKWLTRMLWGGVSFWRLNISGTVRSFRGSPS